MVDTISVPSDFEIHRGMATLHVPRPPEQGGGWRLGIFPTEELRGEGAMISSLDDMLTWLAHLRSPHKTVGSEAIRAALFEESEIRSVGDTTSATSGGYVLQARVPNATDKGYVFLNSSLTHGPGPGPLQGDVPTGATWLARSAGGPGFDNIAFINCKMDSHVAPAGWAGLGVNNQPAPNPVTATAASGWREFGTTDLAGNPLNLATRVGGFQLSAGDVAAGFATRKLVFGAFNGNAGWEPQP
eukprot:gene31912-36025_t